MIKPYTYNWRVTNDSNQQNNSNQYNVLINTQKNDAQGISGAQKNDRVQGQTQQA